VTETDRRRETYRNGYRDSDGNRNRDRDSDINRNGNRQEAYRNGDRDSDGNRNGDRDRNRSPRVSHSYFNKSAKRLAEAVVRLHHRDSPAPTLL